MTYTDQFPFIDGFGRVLGEVVRVVLREALCE